MSLRKLPAVNNFVCPKNFEWDMPSDVFAKWTQGPHAKDSDDANTITIFDVIGFDIWTGGGFTAKRMSAALRSIGNNDVTVQINSPGGDMFEGLAIYNLLRDHPAKVTVHVMGWAASAGSIIAMAADEIRMGLGSFIMIHNAWGCVCGNRHDMREAADVFDGFDAALVDIYEARTSIDESEITKMMDKETFLSAKEAVAKGFADEIDEGISVSNDPENQVSQNVLARREVEGALAKAGHTRAERSKLLAEIFSEKPAPRDASQNTAERDAGVNPVAVMQLIEKMKS